MLRWIFLLFRLSSFCFAFYFSPFPIRTMGLHCSCSFHFLTKLNTKSIVCIWARKISSMNVRIRTNNAICARIEIDSKDTEHISLSATPESTQTHTHEQRQNKSTFSLSLSPVYFKQFPFHFLHFSLCCDALKSAFRNPYLKCLVFILEGENEMESLII